VSGRLRQRSYEIKEGEERTVYEVAVDGTDASEVWYAWSPRHQGATLPCHQQEQQTVTAAWAEWKPCCPIGNSGPIVY
jgi:single-stranded DNA-binding protein